MLSSAIIVFREVFEIVLIVGIVLAATRGMPFRGKAIFAGFAAGLFGAALVAIFIERISSFAEGMGQEYFNAGVLLTAAAFIGWTVIWMKQHAREMKSNFEKLGQSILEGDAPSWGVSVVIALAMLREGSEIVLFTYGMLASGQEPLSLAAGALAGLVGGTAIGGMLYFGMIHISLRYFFQITSALLILLVAGMVSQAVGFITATGALSSLSDVVWDSSWLLDDRGFIGASLHTLIGYTSTPSAAQLIAYAVTLAVMLSATNLLGGVKKKPLKEQMAETMSAAE